MTREQAQALQRIAAVVIEACDAAGSLGAPSGVLYAGLMAQGCTLSQYQQITDGLVRAGMLTRAGHLLHATDKGRTFARIPGGRHAS